MRNSCRNALLSAVVPAASAVAFAPGADANAPGSAGTPSAPVAVYTENFENGVTDTPTLLRDYVGASGMTYTSSSAYDGTNCNGAVLDFNSPASRSTIAGCNSSGYNVLRQMAQNLGALPGGPAGANSNHAVAAYTSTGTEPANGIMFETARPVPLSSANRFITFSVDTDETACQVAHAQLKFYLVDGTDELATFTSPIDPCAGANPGTHASNQAVLFTGSQLGIRLRNGQTQTNGNDLAFDNIRVLDATPQLDKGFSPGTIALGDTSTLTFTITNTSDLADKDGWSITDTLPSGLTVAGPGTSDCAAATITAAGGAASIAVTGGDLAAGTASCTVTVPVTAASAGTYTNGAGNVAATGVDAPADATLTVAPVVDTPMVDGGVAGGLALLVLGTAGGVLYLRRRTQRGTAWPA